MKKEVPMGAMIAAIAFVVIVAVFFGFRALFPHRDSGPSAEDMRKHMSGQSGTYGMSGGGGAKMGSYPSSTGSPIRGGASMSGGMSGSPMSSGMSGGAPSSGGQ